MTSTEQTSPVSFGLLRAAEAATNWRALAMTGLAGLAVLVSTTLTLWLMRNSVLLGAVGALVTVVVFLAGYSAVGILLMRQAQGREAGFGDVMLQALFVVHRLLGVAALLLIAFIGVTLAALLILWLCKLPGLGPLLYSVALPVLTVVIGTAIAGMLYVVLPLAAPAIWEGNTVFGTVARLLEVVRKRLLFVIIDLVILSLLVMVLSGIVSLILFSGYSTTMGLSAAVGISPFGGLGGMFSGPSAMGGAYGMEAMARASSYTGAMGFGSGLLFLSGAIIPLLTFINGSCLIYLRIVSGLEFGATEQKLRGHVDEARRRAQAAAERASARLDEARGPAVRPPASPAANRTCSQCQTSLAADDVFCGECGTKNPL